MSKRLNIQLLIIDPQNDFLGNADGSPYSVKLSTKRTETADLPVPGAVEDMQRLAAFVKRVGPTLADIHVTLDSHRVFDVGHASMWMDQNGRPPQKFTQISERDICTGIWTTRNPSHRQRMMQYAHELEANGRYKITIWSDLGHCLIGTWGHNVYSELNDALQNWSATEVAMVNYVTKGSNPWTEHYGALMAEVPDPNDPGTGLNTGLLQTLSEADIIVTAGEAGSHCLLATLQQIAANIGKEHIKKFRLLLDCTSPVPAIPNVVDFPAIMRAGFNEMTRLGMVATDSVSFLA